MTRDEIEDADTAADGRMHRVPAHGLCYILMLRERATPEQRADPTWKPMMWKRPTEAPATFAELKPPGYWDGERFVEPLFFSSGAYVPPFPFRLHLLSNRVCHSAFFSLLFLSDFVALEVPL